MKNYVITGASGGIASAVKAKLLAGGEARVMGIDLKGADCNVNLATAEGRKAAVDAVHETFPEGINGLVCCAGISGAGTNYALMMQVNFYGASAIAEGCFDLLEKKAGYCVMLSSFSIAEGYVIPDFVKMAMEENSEEKMIAVLDSMGKARTGLGSAVYITSKYCLTLWVRRRAALWGSKHVHINCVAPGTTNTGMVANMNERAMSALKALPVPSKYGESLMLEPEEVADVICFLLSPASKGMHGTMIFVDGGCDAVINTEHVY